MDDECPNYSVILDMANGLEEEYDLESRIARYSSSNPELIEFATENGLTNDIDAGRALFIADFILTSSESPAGKTDEERRSSIIKCFINGLENRTTKSESLLRIFYLAQKIATAIRRNDHFLAGRGLDRDTSLLIIKDIYIAPYLVVSQSILGENKIIGWEFSILASALKQSMPDEELKKYKSMKTGILQKVWGLLNEFRLINQVNFNPTSSIANIEKSSVILITKFTGLPNISLWNTNKFASKEEKKLVTQLLTFMNKTDRDQSIVYFRGKIFGTDENIILVRHPYMKGKPLVIFKTLADELNVSMIMSILKLRSQEENEWSKVENLKRSLIEDTIKEVTEEVIVEEERERTVEVISDTTTVSESKGFMGKIKGLFRSKKDPKAKKPKTRKEKYKVEKKVKKKVKKTQKKEIILADQIPDFVSKAVSVFGIGELNLFEIWDTVRESDYIIVGTLESDFENNKTMLYAKERLGDPLKLSNTLDGLDKSLESVINYFFTGENQILPAEVMFMTEDDTRFLISFEGNEDRIVGTIATTYQKDTVQTEEIDFVKRRTLVMRTGQLLSSRVHTPFDTSVERIYGPDMVKKSEYVELDKALLSLRE